MDMSCSAFIRASKSFLSIYLSFKIGKKAVPGKSSGDFLTEYSAKHKKKCSSGFSEEHSSYKDGALILKFSQFLNEVDKLIRISPLVIVP